MKEVVRKDIRGDKGQGMGKGQGKREGGEEVKAAGRGKELRENGKGKDGGRKGRLHVLEAEDEGRALNKLDHELDLSRSRDIMDHDTR